MAFSNKIVLSLFSVLILSLSANAGVSIAKSGEQCSDDESSKPVRLSCFTPDGVEPGEELVQIAFDIIETQVCRGGSIVSLSKRIEAHVASDLGAVGSQQSSDVKFAGKRIRFDDYAGNLSVELPSSVVIRAASSVYVLDITSETVPLYSGAAADNYALNGSYKKLSSAGAETASGRVLCYATR